MLTNYLVEIGRSFSYKISFEEILHVQQELRDIRITTSNDSFLIKGKIGDMQERLPKWFIKCHSYCYVNANRIYKIGEDTFFFDCGVELTIGKSKFVEARKQFNKYLESIMTSEGDMEK